MAVCFTVKYGEAHAYALEKVGDPEAVIALFIL